MNICEGCIKQDVCQFKKVVEKWENSKKGELPHPLVPVTECRYKKKGNCTWTICSPCVTYGTTTTTDNPNWTYTVWNGCGDDLTVPPNSCMAVN